MYINNIRWEFFICDEENWINYIIDNDSEVEECEWEIRELDDLIDNLIDWISEFKSFSDKVMIKEDLKYLIKFDDEYIFSSTTTNEYVIKSDNETDFNNLCKDFIYYKQIKNGNIQ